MAVAYVNASTGAADAGGAFTHTGMTPGAAGRIIILQILQDGTTDGAVTQTSATNITALDGTANTWTAIGEYQVGDAESGRQYLWVGRSTGTSAPTFTGGNSTSEDVFARMYEFSGVDANATTVAGILENATAGTIGSVFATSTTCSDVSVQTTYAGGMALNFVALSDDAMGLAVFDGETGGNWQLTPDVYSDSAGTDGTIALMRAEMASAGTIDGGSDTITSIGWGVIGFALIPELSPTTALNTPADTATGQSTTPTLNFTGTDANSDQVEYQVQVDTVDTFNSTGGNPLISALSVTPDAGFSNPDDGADLHPWASGVDINYVVGTDNYYFDGSDAAASDPNSVWTNETNADDGDISTAASCSTNGSTSSNYLMIEGTNAVNGGTISQVRARMYNQAAASNTEAKIYTDGLSELLGTITDDGADTGWTSYSTLTTPSGGWTWTKIQALETKVYRTSGMSASIVTKIEIEVTHSLTASTTYYWRVRAIDPTGSNTYGAWATTRSFTTASGTSTSTTSTSSSSTSTTSSSSSTSTTTTSSSTSTTSSSSSTSTTTTSSSSSTSTTTTSSSTSTTTTSSSTTTTSSSSTSTTSSSSSTTTTSSSTSTTTTSSSSSTSTTTTSSSSSTSTTSSSSSTTTTSSSTSTTTTSSSTSTTSSSSSTSTTTTSSSTSTTTTSSSTSTTSSSSSTSTTTTSSSTSTTTTSSSSSTTTTSSSTSTTTTSSSTSTTTTSSSTSTTTTSSSTSTTSSSSSTSTTTTSSSTSTTSTSSSSSTSTTTTSSSTSTTTTSSSSSTSTTTTSSSTSTTSSSSSTTTTSSSSSTSTTSSSSSTSTTSSSSSTTTTSSSSSTTTTSSSTSTTTTSSSSSTTTTSSSSSTTTTSSSTSTTSTSSSSTSTTSSSSSSSTSTTSSSSSTSTTSSSSSTSTTSSSSSTSTTSSSSSTSTTTTLPAGDDRYWVGGTGDWSDATNHWATSSGGSPGAGNLPTSSNNAFIDSSSGFGSGGTITVNAQANCNNFLANSGHSYTLTGSSWINVFGNFTSESTITCTLELDFQGNGGTNLLDFNGMAINDEVWFYDNSGGTWQLQSDMSITGATVGDAYIQGPGTFDANNYNISVGDTIFLQASSTYSPTINMGSGTWTLGGDWSLSESGIGVVTINAGTSELIFTDNQNFYTGGKTYYNVTAQVGLTFYDNATFNNLTIQKSTGNFLLNYTFESDKTYTINGSFNAVGDALNHIGIVASGANQHVLTKSSGEVRGDYLEITGSNATGGAVWSAGPRSTDGGNNSGWIFQCVLGQENGLYEILQENGYYILLEDCGNATTTSTSTTSSSTSTTSSSTTTTSSSTTTTSSSSSTSTTSSSSSSSTSTTSSSSSTSTTSSSSSTSTTTTSSSSSTSTTSSSSSTSTTSSSTSTTSSSSSTSTTSSSTSTTSSSSSSSTSTTSSSSSSSTSTTSSSTSTTSSSSSSSSSTSTTSSSSSSSTSTTSSSSTSTSTSTSTTVTIPLEFDVPGLHLGWDIRNETYGFDVRRDNPHGEYKKDNVDIDLQDEPPMGGEASY